MQIDRGSTEDTPAEATTVLKQMATEVATHEATVTAAVMSIPPTVLDRNMGERLMEIEETLMEEDHLEAEDMVEAAVDMAVVGVAEAVEVKVQTSPVYRTAPLISSKQR
mmetsp:Transcript_38487/g.93121  ORF Transcript_38487/g.93121 Transcript_38487/m.93121 type:complete len:109 (-) Transcript_38487:2911-3237(-)